MRPRKARQVKSNVDSMLKKKNSFWQAKQSIPHTTVMFNGDCVKMCEDFAPNFDNKRTGCWLHHDNAPSYCSFFFTKEYFTKNNMIVVPHPSCFSLFLY
jgi:hypothetical protein